MICITDTCFSPKQICESGQCFRMNQTGDTAFSVVALDRFLSMKVTEEAVLFDCSEEEYASFWRSYFDLDTDYGKIQNLVDPKDSYLKRVSAAGSGIRILNQDLWEMIVTFLISQQNNIRRIRRCVELLCERYGELKTAKDGTVYYTFPKPEALSGLDEDALKECNLGYRSKYVVRTARSICEGEVSLEYISSLSYPYAKAELKKLYGVGEKVADCICLFALHKLEAFPVDTHIRQVLDREYPHGFPFSEYEGVAGVIQQYIFYGELHGKEGE